MCYRELFISHTINRNRTSLTNCSTTYQSLQFKMPVLDFVQHKVYWFRKCRPHNSCTVRLARNMCQWWAPRRIDDLMRLQTFPHSVAKCVPFIQLSSHQTSLIIHYTHTICLVPFPRRKLPVHINRENFSSVGWIFRLSMIAATQRQTIVQRFLVASLPTHRHQSSTE